MLRKEKIDSPLLVKRRKTKMMPYFLVLPVLLLFLAFTYYPFAKAAVFSFSLTDSTGGFVKWAGWANWTRVLSKKSFWDSVVITLEFAAMNLVLTFSIALLFALLCVKVCKGNRLLQTIFALPMAIASSPAAAIWLFIYRQDAGVLNSMLGTGTAWLRDAATALPAVSVVTAWMHIGTSFIFLLVGFRNVPEDLLEAATIDGAGAFTKSVKIILPIASPQIFFVLFLNITSAFKSFAQIKLLTGGGPANATKTLIYEVYSQAMINGRFETACVYALALFLVIFITTRIQFFTEKWLVHYQ